MPVLRSSRRSAAVSIAVGALVAAGLSAASPAPAADRAESSRPQAAAPAFLVASSARGESLPRPRSVSGRSSLVTLLCMPCSPGCADGQPIRFDLGRQSVTGRFTHIEHNLAYTAWTGSLDVDLGTFAIVRSGSVYRASIASPKGLCWRSPRARGTRYWLTAVAPYDGLSSGADTITQRPTRAERQHMAAGTTTAARKKRGQARIDVLFAYTPSAKAAAGSKAALKAAVGQAAAVTNLAFDNSGIKAKIRVKGIVKVKGTESNNVIKDLRLFGSSVRATASSTARCERGPSATPTSSTCSAAARPTGSAGRVPCRTRCATRLPSRGCPRCTYPACPTSSRRTSSATTGAPTTSPTPASVTHYARIPWFLRLG